MIIANFNAYNKYVTDSLHQWDLNRVLQVTGLNLTAAPEVHFSNANTDRAIVRQATMTNHVVTVKIPNSLLQEPLRIKAHIGIYEGDEFKVVELVEIPVTARKRPLDYQIQDTDEEIYSFKQLENKVANLYADLDSGKVDKGGAGQVTLAMLAQDAKKAMTGGSVPVVGEGSVSAVNIVDNSVTGKKLQARVLATRLYAGNPDLYDTPVLTINTSGKTAVANSENTGSYRFITANGYTDISPATVTISTQYWTGTIGVEFYLDPVSKILYVANFNTHNDTVDACLYLGFVTSPYEVSTSILPVKHNGTVVSARSELKPGYREMSMLYFAWYNASGTKVVPRVDFNNRKLIIPPHGSAFAMGHEKYVSIGGSSENGLEIPFPEQEGYCYLVGGENGLKFVSSTEFNTTTSRFDIDGAYYFGFINEATKTVSFTFDCETVRTASILGDSISTFTGYIPAGNANYYGGANCGVTHVNQTWWKRVLNRCGLELNKNNAWSGSRVTNTASEGSNGMARATLLDNGTNPDIIFVALGINDFNGGIAVGTYDGKGELPTDGSTFREAYAIMLSSIQKKYKTAKVYAMTLLPAQRTIADVTSPEVNISGTYLAEYNAAIREIADAFCVEVIDLASCGISYYNANIYMGDYADDTGLFLHPNAEGHRLISEKVIKALQ